MFLVTDSCDEFNIPQNVRFYRTSLYKSKKKVMNFYYHIFGKV